MEAQENQVALPLRSHTILGACEAVGEDFGFNPTFLRVPFAAIVLYSPLLAIGAYFALGVVVLASRLLFPKAKDEAVVTTRVEAAPITEQRRNSQKLLRSPPGLRPGLRADRATPGAGAVIALRRTPKHGKCRR